MYSLEVFSIRQIIIDYSNNVTLFGYLHDCGFDDFLPWDFCCSFNMLTDMLLSAGAEGDTLVKIISEKLSDEIEIPTIIDAECIFGKPVFIDNFNMEVYEPFEENEEGQLVVSTDRYYIIDSMVAKDGTISKNEMNNEQTAEDEMNDCLTSLRVSYQYYLNLVLQDCDEKEARYCAGLTDGLLFRMAYLQDRMIN